MFSDALLAKEAALSLAEERLETINMLEIRIRQQREEYEALLDIKVTTSHLYYHPGLATNREFSPQIRQITPKEIKNGLYFVLRPLLHCLLA